MITAGNIIALSLIMGVITLIMGAKTLFIF